MSLSHTDGVFQRPKLSLNSDDASGVRSLPDLIHFNAKTNANHNFCKQAELVGRKDGENVYSLRVITMNELKSGIDSCVTWISSLTGGTGGYEKGPVALYLESDIGLFIFLAALLEMGIPVLLLSARLSPTTVNHLLLETKARRIFLSPRTKTSLGRSFNGVVETVVPRYASLLDQSPTKQSYEISQVERKSVECEEKTQYPLILHSSGTTGMPKPIPVSGRYPIVYAACHEFPVNMAIEWANMSTLPLYHGFGLLAPCLSLSVGLACCFPPSTLIPSAHSTMQLLQTFLARSLMTVPSILDDMLGMEGVLASFEFVAIGGGHLNSDTGVTMAKVGVPLLNHYGVTEIGALAPIFCPGPDYDWNYLRIRTDLDLKIQPIAGEDDGGELDRRQNKFKLIGLPIDSTQPFEIQDEMEKRPNTDRIEVKLLGRRDDMIVLKTGEKVLARRLEEILSSDAHIKTAVCLGQGYLEVVVLIEPSPSMPSEPDEALGHVWKVIQDCNSQLDQHARVSSRAAVILKPKGKLIPRSDKGSIMRRETHVVFQDEIKLAYAALEVDTLDSLTVSLNTENVEACIQEMVQAISGIQNKDVHSNSAKAYSLNDDFFEAGMDSLQAIRLARFVDTAIRNVVPSERTDWRAKTISAEFIYQHPSVHLLSSAVSHILWGRKMPVDAGKNRQTEMSALLGNALEAMAAASKEEELVKGPGQAVVLITGSTGNLGAHLLGLLARDKRVTRIFCLNRSNLGSSEHSQQSKSDEAQAEERQRRVFSDAGVFLAASDWSKIIFLQGPPVSKQLGMIADSITHIIHLAWPMDFNRKVASFQPHIDAVRDLIGLARSATQRRSDGKKVRLLFSSSIAVVRHYTQCPGRHEQPAVMVPEKAMTDPLVTSEMGYAEAKWICEQLMAGAARLYFTDIETITVRVGQLSGPKSEGVWKTREHIPAMLRASQLMGVFPRLEGTMSWLPVDIAASCLRDIIFQPGPIREGHGDVLHLENPTRQPMQDFATIASRAIGLDGTTTMIPFSEWLDRAKKSACLPSLMAFFEGNFLPLASGEVALDTQQSRKISRTLRGTSAVGMDLIVEYIDRWRQMGFLK